jgi:ABC-2 type transport system permease protein
MNAELKHTLRRFRGRILGWGIGLALYGLFMASFFDSLVELEGLEALLASYPPELLAFFGNITAITTPAGYLDTYYFLYMPVILGIFIIGAAVGLLVGDEERGVLDLILAQPISRTALFWGRVLGLVLVTTLILVIGWLGWAIPSGRTQMGLSWLELWQPYIPLLAQLLLFGALTLLLALILPSARLAAMITGALLVANFLLLGLSNLNEDLQSVVKWTPLYYFQGGYAVNGIEWDKVLWIVAITAFLTLVAWFLFRRRDIRVGGERGWALARPRALLSRRLSG